MSLHKSINDLHFLVERPKLSNLAEIVRSIFLILTQKLYSLYSIINFLVFVVGAMAIDLAKSNLVDIELKTVVASSFRDSSSHVLWCSPVSNRAPRLCKAQIPENHCAILHVHDYQSICSCVLLILGLLPVAFGLVVFSYGLPHKQ